VPTLLTVPTSPVEAVPATPTPTPVVTPLTGAGAMSAATMEASLALPTATEVRTVPAGLLTARRAALAAGLRERGVRAVSFTSLISYAVVQAACQVPEVNVSYAESRGAPAVRRHGSVNLGTLVDVERPDGTRQVRVPSVKGAELLGFAEFEEASTDLFARARARTLSIADSLGTTISVTNPGMIGTTHSVPRLMRGQGLLVGVGAVGYPAALQGAAPGKLAVLGIEPVVTVTATYDTRVIAAPTAGAFLAALADVLRDPGYYDLVDAACSRLGEVRGTPHP
jgi:2-oxoglutarate decarboxylase